MRGFIRMRVLCLFCAQLSFNCLAQPAIIATDVGPGLPVNDTITTNEYSNDGGKATSAQLFPSGVAVDSAGNLYIADSVNQRIRKVTPAGAITPVAGNGTNGFSGDGGQATSAQLSSPRGVAVDSAGNLYIADTNNNCIRKVTRDGVITTVAGIGTKGYSGDGGKATSAQLSNPNDVAVDSAGNLFIADSGNRRIRKVNPDGVITSVAGIGTEIGRKIVPGRGPGAQSGSSPSSGRSPRDVDGPPMTPGGTDMTNPVVLQNPVPPYTEEARKAGIEGIVAIQAIIRKDGSVDSFKVLKSLGYGLDQSAITTIASKWKFTPGTYKGEPVDVKVNFEIRFTLR
jgi:TonB family protein